jgi:vacuole morphology and inheritance protein 14
LNLELLLGATALRALSDRSFERRKAGAQEVERLLRRLSREGASGAATARRVLSALASDYACSVSSNHRKGGLLALASAAIGLGASALADNLDVVVPAVLRSFADVDARVRYYACESLFNVAKVARGAVLRYFAEVFGGVCALAADSDVDVKNGAGLLDRRPKASPPPSTETA